MIMEKISASSESYCTKHNVVLLNEAVKDCYCKNCDFRAVRNKINHKRSMSLVEP